MAKTTSQSAAIAALKKASKGAWKDSRDTEAKPGGFQNLPGGIRNGVGRVVSTNFDMSEDTGKGSHPTAQVRFVTREPIEYEGVQQTIFYNFRDTDKKTVSDVMDQFAADLQLLGLVTQNTDEDDIPRLLDELVEKKPYFLFNTSQGKKSKEYPNPSTFVNVQGLAVDYVPPPDEPTEEEVVAAAEQGKPAPKGPVKSPPKKGVKGPVKGPIKAPEPVEEEVVSEEEAIAEDDTPGWEPKPEENYYSVVSGEKTVVEVVSVDEAAKTANVKVVSDGHKMTGKTVKKAWSDLLGE